MAINKIIKFGLEEEASKLKEQGNSDQSIANELSKSSGQKITRSTVYRYFSNSNRDPVVRNIKQREEVISKAVNSRLETAEQLERINKAALYILKEALQSAEYNVALKAIREVTNQLELQSKIIGDISDQPTVNINFVQNQFNDFKQIVLGVMCDECRDRLSRKLQEVVGK